MRSAVKEESAQYSNRRMTRSAYNQKKLEDDFANRRRTCSSFKQQQQQQKKQQGGKKPLRRWRKKKEEPLLLTDFYPEDKDFRIDRYDEPDPTVPPFAWRSTHFRYFTPEEREAYHKRVEESEGFDSGSYPLEVCLSNPITEISLERRSYSREYSTYAAKRALTGYNKKKRTKYQFVKLVRVCVCSSPGEYYITFQAMQDGRAPSPPRNFQALVLHKGTRIKFCREEKKPKLTEGPGETSQQ
ncbi:hypothetical protein Vadar_028551 [Vaccinium darrowii]|uniref:Uncharacterized protein n=1 Tax=Vaccinium darrowii TaxID=229202 RepID=A0ACB7ZFF5_9ERIC|nr:hypothetical protein Vadar_028551 [Vaccinium darrowii]